MVAVPQLFCFTKVTMGDQSFMVAVPQLFCFTKVTMGDRSLMVAVPQLWNSLPISIRSACTTNDFKQKLKTFYSARNFVRLVLARNF